MSEQVSVDTAIEEMVKDGELEEVTETSELKKYRIKGHTKAYSREEIKVMLHKYVPSKEVSPF
jgi:hypothetical protein